MKVELDAALADVGFAGESATAGHHGAERVYRSDAMKKALEGVASGIGKEIGKRIELATVDTAGPATQCVQAFLGPRYGATIAAIVATGTGRECGVDPSQGGARVSTGQVLVEGTDSARWSRRAAGAQAAINMASARIGQRVVGSILGRLVSVVAGGVGLIPIAKDIWDFRHGVLPIIAHGDEVKDTRTRCAMSWPSPSASRSATASRRSATRPPIAWWRSGSSSAALTPRWWSWPTAKWPSSSFLDTVKPDDLAKLDEGGSAGAGRARGDAASPGAWTTARCIVPSADCRPAPSRSPARRNRWRRPCSGRPWPATAWSKVVEFEIYRQARPDAFTRGEPAAAARPAGSGCRDTPCCPPTGCSRCAVRVACQRCQDAGPHT